MLQKYYIHLGAHGLLCVWAGSFWEKGLKGPELGACLSCGLLTSSLSPASLPYKEGKIPLLKRH